VVTVLAETFDDDLSGEAAEPNRRPAIVDTSVVSLDRFIGYWSNSYLNLFIGYPADLSFK
jgi:hypothetical protein